MIESIGEFRETYPQYNNFSDEEVVSNLHKHNYPDIPEDAIAVRLGVKPKGLNELMNSEEYLRSKITERDEAKSNYIDKNILPSFPEANRPMVKQRLMATLAEAEQHKHRRQVALDEAAFKVWDNQELNPTKPDLTLGRVGGAIKEGGKDVIRQSVLAGVATLEEGAKRQRAKPIEEAFVKHRGVQVMSPMVRSAYSDAVVEFHETTGRAPTEPERKQLLEAIRTKRYNDYMKVVGTAHQFITEKLKTDPDYLQSSGFIEDVARMGPQVAGQITMSLVGGPLAGMAGIFAQIVGSTYEGAIASGVEPDRALKAGFANAIMQAPLEQLGISKAAKLFKVKTAVAKKLKAIGTAMSTEYLTELLQAWPDAITQLWATDPNADILEKLNTDADWHIEQIKKGNYEGLVAATLAGGAAGIAVQTAGLKQKAALKRAEKAKADYEKAINDELGRINEELNELKNDPNAKQEDIDTLQKHKTVVEGMREEESVEVKSFEEEIAKEKERHETFLQEEQVKEEEQEEPQTEIEEPVPEELTEIGDDVPPPDYVPEPLKPKEPLSDKEKLKRGKAKAEFRKHKVSEIEQMGRDEIYALVDAYKEFGEDNFDKLDKARYKRALKKAQFFERMDYEAGVFEGAMEGATSFKQQKPVYTEEEIQKAREEAGVAEDVPVTIVNIKPETYLDLTTATDRRKEAIVTKSPDFLIPEKIKEEGAPLLVVDDTGQVTGHDGRHRAATLKKSGKANMPVVVFGETPKAITAQKFGEKQRLTKLIVGEKPTVSQPKEVDDVRPKRYRGTSLVNPKGQHVIPGTGIGTIFSREGIYENTGGMKVREDGTAEERGFDFGREQMDVVESEIANGTWKYQELFDKVLQYTPSIEFIFKEMETARGRCRTFFKKGTTEVGAIHIYVNPKTFNLVHADPFDAADVVLVHELIHALYSVRVGHHTKLEQDFYNDIEAAWNSIPQEYRDQFTNMAVLAEAADNGNEQALEFWDGLSDEQQSRYITWNSIISEIQAGRWDELMTYALSDPNIAADLYQTPVETDVKKPKDNFMRRMMRRLFDFFFKQDKDHEFNNAADILIEIHEKYAEASSHLAVPTYAGISPAEEFRNSLDIQGHKGFPKGSKKLNAAIKTKDNKIYHSPLAHFDIVTSYDYDELFPFVTGFAAVDAADHPLAFYTRKEAADIVDPERRVVSGNGNMQSEDIPDIHLDRDVKKPAKEQIKKRKRLTDADRAILEARKAARGGKSLVQVWADKRKQSQREYAAVKQEQQVKAGIPADRWRLTKATDGLNSMKDHTLETEYGRVLNEINDMLRKGAGKKNKRLSYYKTRKDAIELLQEKRRWDKINTQKLREKTQKAKAGETKKSQIRFFKAEYKRLVKLDAPYSAVQFTKSQLIDLMGPEKFYRWSGEKPMELPKPAKVKAPQAPPVIAKAIEPEKPKGPKVTKLPPFTEEMHKEREKAHIPVPPKEVSSQKARERFDKVIDHLQDFYIDKGEALSEEGINGVATTIEQAKLAGAIDEAEYQQAINILASAAVAENMEPKVVDRNTKLHKFDDPQIEEQARKAESGYAGPTFFEKMGDILSQFRNMFREFEHLKRKDFGDVQYRLRQLQKGRADAARRAVEALNSILSNLDRDQYRNLQRLAYLMDLREQVLINKDKIAKGEDPDNAVANPFGWDDDTILKESKKAWEVVNNDPETYNAWRKRQDTWFRIRMAYKDAMDRVGFDTSRRLNRVYYFRHQILNLLAEEHGRYGLKGSNKLAVPTKRSYLRKRGAKKPYAMNLNYIQAEFEVMAQMMYDTQISDTLDKIMLSHGTKQSDLEGYSLYRPREESIFYMANTVPGHIVQGAINQGLGSMNIPTNKIGKALALGGKYEGWYLPDPVAATLNDALNKRPVGPMMKALKFVMTKWKMWQLLNPLRAFKYNARNMTGDAEAVFIGSPGVFNYVPKAMADLFTWKWTGKAPEELQEWIDRGGSETTLQSQEIQEMLAQPEFFKQLGKSKAWHMAKHPLKYATRMVRWPTDLRESLLRYAAYKKFKRDLAKGKKRYVASIPEEVDALDDNRDKAFMMSNDLLGAYDRVSRIGHNLRDYLIPFWSFQEVNMKRTLAMLRNAFNDDKAVGTAGRFLGAKTALGAIKVGKLAIKIMAFSMMLQAWNRLVFPDEEDALPEEMRGRSHLILARRKTKDGKPEIIYFPRIGVVGDLLEWGGLETAPSDLWDMWNVITGNKTIKDIVEKYDGGKENFEGVINKIAQGLGPQYKLPLELLTKEKFFPSVFNRQPITDRVRYLAEQFSAVEIYDAFAGRPTRHDHWARTMSKAFIYREDKARFGWLAIQQKIADYKKKHKLKGDGFVITETGTALYNMGLAWRYGDEQALKKYLIEYIKAATFKLTKKINIRSTIAKQWEKLNPLASLPEKHRKLFLAQLNSREQYQLGLAFKYYAEIKSGKQFTKSRN